MGSNSINYTSSFGKFTIIQGLTSSLDITSVRNNLVSFGSITFCGELLDTFQNIFLLNTGSNFVFTWNRLKVEVNPYYEGRTFL